MCFSALALEAMQTCKNFRQFFIENLPILVSERLRKGNGVFDRKRVWLLLLISCNIAEAKLMVFVCLQ